MGNIAMQKQGVGGLRLGRCGSAAAAVAAVLLAAGSAGAFEIRTGNDDISLNWDNTLRYTYGYRVQGQNKTIINSANFDDGDRNFDVGTVMNRLDILSELGFVYKKDFGFKLSGAGWYDQRYNDGLDNKSLATSNFINNAGQQAIGLSGQTKDQNRGPNGELLDAFAFAKADLGEVPVYLKVGRSTVYWGEGLLNPIHAISYSQFPVDFAKALAMPGVEVKELFRPLNNVTVTAQPTNNLTVSAQYFMEWGEYKYAESGSYLAAFDFMQRGGQSLILAPGFAIRSGGLIEPHPAGDFGVMAKWQPDWLNGTLGFYYRNFTDKQPQLGLLFDGAVPTNYFMTYPTGINLYGVSLGKTIGDTAVGAEVSYRTRMPLNSGFGLAFSPQQLPKPGEAFGARGQTLHALVNALNILKKSPLWDLAVIMGEVDYSRVVSVTSNPNLYSGNDPTAGLARPTKDYVEATIGFTPTWYQVIPGVDFTMPMTIGSGLVGTSGVMFGGNKHAGSWGVGIGADIFQKYKADIKYAGYFGALETDPATGGIKTATGYGYYKDRGMLTLTLKTTF